MEPAPCRSANRRHALGVSTTIHSTTTRTSRITIVTPRRPTFAPWKTLVKGHFQLVDGGETRCADYGQRFSLLSPYVPRTVTEGKCFFGAQFSGAAAGSTGARPPPAVVASHGNIDVKTARD